MMYKSKIVTARIPLQSLARVARYLEGDGRKRRRTTMAGLVRSAVELLADSIEADGLDTAPIRDGEAELIRLGYGGARPVRNEQGRRVKVRPVQPETDPNLVEFQKILELRDAGVPDDEIQRLLGLDTKGDQNEQV